MNQVELVRAYMCKHCLTVDMFTGLAGAIQAAQKSQLLAQGPPAENVGKYCQIAVRYDGLSDSKVRVHMFGYGSFVTPLFRTEPRETGISPPIM